MMMARSMYLVIVSLSQSVIRMSDVNAGFLCSVRRSHVHVRVHRGRDFDFERDHNDHPRNTGERLLKISNPGRNDPLSINRRSVEHIVTAAVSRGTSAGGDESQVSKVPVSYTSEQQRSRIELETVSRIAIPSLIVASICYATFPTIVSTLATNIHDAYDGGAGPTYYGAETLNLILNDNSNQFVQNMHNFCALLFSLLTGYTFAFVYRQQEKVYYALFEEVSAAASLLEQMALATEGRTGVYRTLLKAMQAYVRYDMKMQFSPINDDDDNENDADVTATAKANAKAKATPEDIPALLLSTRPSKDPLETILYVTSVGTPSSIYSTVRQLRQSRSRRLAAMQRKMPELNLYLLYILGFMAWVTFPVVAAGSSTVGGEGLLNVQRVQLSLGILAMGGVLGIINELKVPVLNVSGDTHDGGADSSIRSVYGVDFSVLETLREGLEDEISVRMAKCDEADANGNNIVTGFLASASLINGRLSDNDNATRISSLSLSEMTIEDDDRKMTMISDLTPVKQNQTADYDQSKIVTKPSMLRRLLNRIRRRQS